MELIKQQIQITLTKTDMTNILNEAMQDETANASIKRILNPFLADSFPQFSEFNAVTLGDTADDGSTTAILKKRVEKVAAGTQPEDQSNEDSESPIDEPESGVVPDEESI